MTEQTESCGNCRFRRRAEIGSGKFKDKEVQECHYESPTRSSHYRRALWPEVYETWWCGRWEEER